jgi:hypothetical protein
VIWLVGAYAAAGLVFAVGFVTVGVPKVDPVAKGSPVGFRLLILPGCALLWPLLLGRWMRSR